MNDHEVEDVLRHVLGVLLTWKYQCGMEDCRHENVWRRRAIYSISAVSISRDP
jgi:hypothetical protein